MNRLTVTNHDPAAELVAEVFYVDPAGNPDSAPVRRQALPHGVPTCVSLAEGNVLVVRPAGDRWETAEEAA